MPDSRSRKDWLQSSASRASTSWTLGPAVWTDAKTGLKVHWDALRYADYPAVDWVLHWVATQYHRSDLNEGMILAFRRPDSPYCAVQVSLRGIDPNAIYEVSRDSTGRKDKEMVPGSSRIRGVEIVLPQKRSSDLIVYRKAKP